MANRYGFTAVNDNLNKGVISGLRNLLQNEKTTFSIGRVTGINLSPSSSSELGQITYVNVDENPQDVSQVTDENELLVAKPFLTNQKSYPLVNELVLLLYQPDTGLMSNTSSKSTYYMSILSVWNHPHHNAIPHFEGNKQSSQKKSYVETELGSPVKTTNTPTEIFLGETFKEKSNIHPLLPFEGDIIWEGRWGNSIRFGSTIINQNKPLNNWSSGSTNGDPITIIRNGQGNQNDNGWSPITENINNDNSSVYLTSTQQIPLIASSTNYFSYNSDNAPTQPDQYKGNQVILNSGRILINSTSDHVLLSSAKSIGLNSLTSVNIDTPNLIIQSNKIYLGSKNATEPLLKGDTTVKLLNQLISNLKQFMIVCSTVVSTGPGNPILPLNTVSRDLISTLSKLETNLENLKSKDNFTS